MNPEDEVVQPTSTDAAEIFARLKPTYVSTRPRQVEASAPKSQPQAKAQPKSQAKAEA